MQNCQQTLKINKMGNSISSLQQGNKACCLQGSSSKHNWQHAPNVFFFKCAFVSLMPCKIPSVLCVAERAHDRYTKCRLIVCLGVISGSGGIYTVSWICQ